MNFFLISAKSGCEIEKASTMVKHVIENCPNLDFIGLMTIGEYGYDVSKGPNPDFLTLKECKANVCKDLNIDTKKVELSMGMSTDFEHAVSTKQTFILIFKIKKKKFPNQLLSF